MFRVVLVMLTCTGVLWHASVGCCAHHEHDSREASVAPRCGCCDAHKHALIVDLAASEGACQWSCKQSESEDPCGGARCSFPAPGTSGDAPLKATIEFSMPLAPWDIRPRVVLSPAISSAAAHEAPPPISGAVRRHLAFSVLLI